jgi:hypothetical protein
MKPLDMMQHSENFFGEPWGGVWHLQQELGKMARGAVRAASAVFFAVILLID